MQFVIKIVIILSPLQIFGQKDVPEEAKQKMEAMEVVFLDPVDSKYSIHLQKKHEELLEYDFQVKFKDQEVLVRLLPEEDPESITHFPHLEFQRLLTHIATNDPEPNIYVYDVPKTEGVDWEIEARFTPKRSLSSREYGTLKVLYKEERGIIAIIYLDKRLQARFEPIVTFQKQVLEH